MRPVEGAPLRPVFCRFRVAIGFGAGSSCIRPYLKVGQMKVTHTTESMRTLAWITTLVLLASACGGGSDKAAPTTAGPTTTATPTATVVPTVTAAPATTEAPAVTATPATTEAPAATATPTTALGPAPSTPTSTPEPTPQQPAASHDGPPRKPPPTPTNGPINLGPPVDPANPPRIAVNNFIDLAPYISITKLRSAYGHNYTFGDDEHDPTGQSCRSMKHYFDAYTLDQRWSGNFGSYDTKGTVNFYAPADGTLMDLVPSSSSAGPEYQFTIQSSEYPRLAFKFHHVDLLENLQNGGTVVAGQHLGYIARFNGQAEIVTYVVLGPGTAEYISFFDVMSDEVFAEYQARGISSRSQMSITKEARDANPIPCDQSDGQGGKFIATGMAEEAFAIWQSGADNWVFLTD